MNLHIGGTEPREGWLLMNIQPGPGVDYVGNVVDLSAFGAASFEQVYASHVLEHLSHHGELVTALKEIRRVLKSDGVAKISVPDLDVLCGLFVRPGLSLDDRFFIMAMIYGAQADAYDFHKVGLNWDFLTSFLVMAGFNQARRVSEFGLFNDTSSLCVHDTPVSLNLEAWTVN